MLKQGLAQRKVLAPLLAAGAMDDQFDTGSSQRRFAQTLCAMPHNSQSSTTFITKERINMQQYVHNLSRSETVVVRQNVDPAKSSIDYRNRERANINRFFRIKKLLGLKFIFAAVGVAGVLLLASCAPAVDTDALAKELTRLDDDWSKAAATKDADKVASFYAKDAIAYPPDEPIAVGQPAAKKVWASYFRDSTYSLSWKTEHAGVTKSGDLGFTAGTFEDSFRGRDGTLIAKKGKYLCTWAKQADGNWKATHDMWNYDSK